MTKTKRIHMRCDEETLETIEAKAREAGGLTVSAYLRMTGMKQKVTPVLPQETRTAVRTLTNNINQLAKACHISGRAPATDEVRRLREEAGRLVKLISEQVGRN